MSNLWGSIDRERERERKRERERERERERVIFQNITGCHHKHDVMRRLIWLYIVCLYPFYGTPGINGLLTKVSAKNGGTVIGLTSSDS